MDKQIIPTQGACTEWYLSDAPELIDWFRSNNYYIAFCDKRKDFVVRTTDPDSDFEEMSFILFATVTIKELSAALTERTRANLSPRIPMLHGDSEIEQSGMGKDIPRISDGPQALEMAVKEEA